MTGNSPSTVPGGQKALAKNGLQPFSQSVSCLGSCVCPSGAAELLSDSVDAGQEANLLPLVSLLWVPKKSASPNAHTLLLPSFPIFFPACRVQQEGLQTLPLLKAFKVK